MYSMIGQIQLAAMRTPKTTANIVAVAPGHPVDQRRRTAKTQGHRARGHPRRDDDPR